MKTACFSLKLINFNCTHQYRDCPINTFNRQIKFLQSCHNGNGCAEANNLEVVPLDSLPQHECKQCSDAQYIVNMQHLHSLQWAWVLPQRALENKQIHLIKTSDLLQHNSRKVLCWPVKSMQQHMLGRFPDQFIIITTLNGYEIICNSIRNHCPVF